MLVGSSSLEESHFFSSQKGWTFTALADSSIILHFELQSQTKEINSNIGKSFCFSANVCVLDANINFVIAKLLLIHGTVD